MEAQSKERTKRPVLFLGQPDHIKHPRKYDNVLYEREKSDWSLYTGLISVLAGLFPRDFEGELAVFPEWVEDDFYLIPGEWVQDDNRLVVRSFEEAVKNAYQEDAVKVSFKWASGDPGDALRTAVRSMSDLINVRNEQIQELHDMLMRVLAEEIPLEEVVAHVRELMS